MDQEFNPFCLLSSIIYMINDIVDPNHFASRLILIKQVAMIAPSLGVLSLTLGGFLGKPFLH